MVAHSGGSWLVVVDPVADALSSVVGAERLIKTLGDLSLAAALVGVAGEDVHLSGNLGQLPKFAIRPFR